MSAPTITPPTPDEHRAAPAGRLRRWFRRGRHRLSRRSPATVVHRCPACWSEVIKTRPGAINQHFITGADGIERCGASDQPFRIAEPHIKWAHA